MRLALLKYAHTLLLFNWRVCLRCYLTHYSFFGLFSYSYTLSVTVLTLWGAPPKMFYNWYRIWWSRNQLWNCTSFLGILQGATGSWPYWRTVTTFRYFEQQQFAVCPLWNVFSGSVSTNYGQIVALRSRLQKELCFLEFLVHMWN